MKIMRIITLTTIVIKHQGKWNFNLLLNDFLLKMMQVLNPKGQTNSLSQKMKNLKCAATISRWSSLQHLHIGNLFYRIDFPGRLVSSHSFFNLQPHQCRHHSLCWIIKRLFSWPLPRISTANLWSGCQINHVIYWYNAELWQLSDR